MKRILFLLFTPLVFAVSCLQGQAQCYNNIGFDSGNFSGWIGYTSGLWWNDDSAFIISPYHTIMSGNAIDCAGNLPVVAPGGGFFSAHLGDTVGHKRRYKLVYTFTVDPADTMLYIKYAVVYGSSFSGGAATNFEIRVLDSAVADTNYNGMINYTGNWIWGYGTSFNGSDWCVGQPNPCSGIGGVSLCGQNQVAYTTWTTATINLSAYIGRPVTFFCMTADDWGGASDFTYAYIDLYCDSVPVSTAEEQSENYSINIFPNPSDGKIIIETTEEMQSIIITDITGRIIYNKNELASTNLTVDLSKESKGIYLVKIMQNGKENIEKIHIE